jgi:hypothetical protein
MKQTLTAVFLIFALASCKKEDQPEPTGNEVEYGAMCNKCTITVTTASGSKTTQVDHYFQYKERNSLQSINITTNGTGLITSYVSVNGVMLHAGYEADQDGEKNYVVYDIKVK